MIGRRGDEASGVVDDVDVVVIGGGLAGLTAALAAAGAGARVTVLDAHLLGGRAQSVERNGFTLNEGGHALFQGAGRAILDRLGVAIGGNRPDSGSYEMVWDDEVVPMPITPTGLATTRLLGLRSKTKLVAIFASLERSLPADSISVDEWLDHRAIRPDLRKYLLAMLRLASYAANPGAQPAGVLFRQLLASRAGVVYVDGGWQRIVDDLRRLATRAGVAIVERQPVRSLESEGEYRMVITDERVIRARAVVIAVGGPKQAVALMGTDPAAWVDRSGEPQRAACLDIGGATGSSTFLLSADEPVYLSLHAPVADLAPTGASLYSLMRYLDGDEGRSAERNRAELEAHATAGGLPAVADRLIDRFLAAPVVTWGRPVVGIDRPTGFERAAEGLFVAGDWLGEHLLADASIVSGASSGTAAAMYAASRSGRVKG